ncbi:hypothetical protein OOT46_17595 [Aquabacterium sp. A7-Y]|nr:hypothetical protein [Aquabacterium sp. A7-Y]
MMMQILLQTPRWVFVLFLALLGLGVMQLAPRLASLRRVSLVPIAMTGLSLYGVISAFPDQPLSLLAWAACAGLAALAMLSRPLPAGTRYDAAVRHFQLPGSSVPLALMMGVFFTKYVAGVALAQAPELAAQAGFAFAFSACYGLFSGLFIGRAARLWRLAAVAGAVAPHAVSV